MNRERKYILIVGAVLLLVGVIYRFLPEFEGFQPMNDEIVLKQRKVLKYQQMVQERNALQEEQLALNRALERAESGLLTGETPALAAVDIQNILNDIAGRSKVEVSAMRVLQPVEPEEKATVKDYLTIPVQITFNTSVRQLKEILYRIETSLKLLRVSEMRVRLGNIKQAEKVFATLTVEGFMKKNKI
ncbi:MAG: hypothetical protein BWK80_16790 [Desulfobacteraceae bacterium IS3]|nr:MAG: hypothetical protein BWK80_16790 [Desulfobacteraceae bacterium IS3]